MIASSVKSALSLSVIWLWANLGFTGFVSAQSPIFAPPAPPAGVDDRVTEGRLYRLPPVPDENDASRGPSPEDLPIDPPRGNAALHQVDNPMPARTGPSQAEDGHDGIPADFEPWWQAAAKEPLRPAPRHIAVHVNGLIVDALRYSPRVQALSDNAIVAETAILRAASEFDTRAFMESKMIKTSVPTGSTLDAGFNVPRLREEDWYYRVGARKKNTFGGRVEASQQIGTRQSNSNFFFPLDQGNSRLTLSYNQPLLNGAGQAYNTSLVVLAELDTRVASDRAIAELQDHLLGVTEGLWELYAQRSFLLQKQRHLQRAETTLIRLEKRRDVDALDSQIARARAAVTMRGTELIRADAAIRNAEARLRALVNSPTLLADRGSELVSVQPPASHLVPMDLHDAVVTALRNRPEVDAATQEIEAARVRLNVAANELMPVLDVVLESYMSGLRGGYDVGQSWVDQFSVGEPSYTAGFVFETALGRRAAQANHQRREAELRQLTNRFQSTLETLHADVEIAVRDVDTSYRELQAKFHALIAANADLDYLQRRWEALPGDDRASSFLLADLLDAQDRLVLAESSFVRSQVDYTVNLTRLKRATGTLLQDERIILVRGCQDGLRRDTFESQQPPSTQPSFDAYQGVPPASVPGAVIASPVGSSPATPRNR